jgi:hypothetical protein
MLFFSKLNYFSFPSSPNSASSPSLTSSGIYNFLRLLNRSLSYSTNLTDELLHELLFMLFKETQALFPNYSRIMQWMKSNLSLIVHPNDATLLIQYLKLFLPLPSESLNQSESFHQFILADPLQLQIISFISKKEWCEKMDVMISDRTLSIENERYLLTKRLFSILRTSISCSITSNRVSPIPFVEYETNSFHSQSLRLKTKQSLVAQTIS